MVPQPVEHFWQADIIGNYMRDKCGCRDGIGLRVHHALPNTGCTRKYPLHLSKIHAKSANLHHVVRAACENELAVVTNSHVIVSAIERLASVPCERCFRSLGIAKIA